MALILFAIGTGPVKGFAVTLSIGILTSMFTAIMCTRAMINLVYGGKKIKQLSIGIKAHPPRKENISIKKRGQKESTNHQ